MILAVLERKAGLMLAGLDVFLNVAGGLRIEEPAIDLPIALAIASSLRNRAVAFDLVSFGEVGLTGEVRGVGQADARLTEAAAMGFKRAIVPATLLDRKARSGNPRLELVGVRSLEEALARAFD
jgi:DNA repair protein RadA/Sms